MRTHADDGGPYVRSEWLMLLAFSPLRTASCRRCGARWDLPVKPWPEWGQACIVAVVVGLVALSGAGTAGTGLGVAAVIGAGASLVAMIGWWAWRYRRERSL